MGHENGGWLNDDQKSYYTDLAAKAARDEFRRLAEIEAATPITAGAYDPPDCAFASPEDPRWEALGDNTAKPMTCANCGEVSTNPGQFTPDGRWLCTESCRKELCTKQSYDDLAASGGIVDAP